MRADTVPPYRLQFFEAEPRYAGNVEIALGCKPRSKRDGGEGWHSKTRVGSVPYTLERFEDPGSFKTSYWRYGPWIVAGELGKEEVGAC